MTPHRAHLVRSSNGVDPRRNSCAVAIADYLGVTDRVRYLHTVADIVRASRTLYQVTWVRHPPFTGREVASLRQWVRDTPQDGVIGYLVRVRLHALLIGPDGTVLVDLDSRSGRDRRKVTHLYRINRRSEKN
jgi:hypothetical protein